MTVSCSDIFFVIDYGTPGHLEKTWQDMRFVFHNFIEKAIEHGGISSLVRLAFFMKCVWSDFQILVLFLWWSIVCQLFYSFFLTFILESLPATKKRLPMQLFPQSII